jgi:hypothetical protein
MQTILGPENRQAAETLAGIERTSNWSREKGKESPM